MPDSSPSASSSPSGVLETFWSEIFVVVGEEVSERQTLCMRACVCVCLVEEERCEKQGLHLNPIFFLSEHSKVDQMPCLFSTPYVQGVHTQLLAWNLLYGVLPIFPF